MEQMRRRSRLQAFYLPVRQLGLTGQGAVVASEPNGMERGGNKVVFGMQ